MTEMENENIESVSEAKPIKHSRFSQTLNKFFHHIDRGATLKGEIMSGLTVFFLAICVIFMNVQLISGALGVNVVVETTPDGMTNIANSSTIAAIYAGSVIVAFIGSLLIGLIARLPFVQISMMGLSASMICLLGTANGLTYYNLLFVSLIAAVIYAVLVSVPVVRDFVFNALPRGVRKILPAATGLIVAFAAAQASGIITASYATIGGSGAAVPVITGGLEGVSSIAFGAAIAAIAIYFVLRAVKLKHPVFWSFIGGTLIFILIMIIANGLNTSSSDSFLNFGRLWVMVSSQASEVTPFGDSWFSYVGSGISGVFSGFGKVFTEGTKFAEGAGGFGFMVSAVLCYLFTGMYDAESTLQATQDDINAKAEGSVDFDSAKGARLALMCNAGMNIVSPFFGVGGVSISKTSVAGTRDSGKSGIVSVVASIGFLVSLFVWAFPFFFATKTYAVGSMNEFNYNAYGNGGFISCFSALSFGVADAVMVCIGAFMLRAFKDINFGDMTEGMPAIATVAGAFLFTNIAYGVACGCIAYCITKLLSFRKNEGDGWIKSIKENFISGAKEIGVPTAVLAVLLFLMLILA